MYQQPYHKLVDLRMMYPLRKDDDESGETHGLSVLLPGSHVGFEHRSDGDMVKRPRRGEPTIVRNPKTVQQVANCNFNSYNCVTSFICQIKAGNIHHYFCMPFSPVQLAGNVHGVCVRRGRCCSRCVVPRYPCKTWSVSARMHTP